MRILTFSTLFPNCELPQHGIFVAERLRHLLMSDELESTVVAPVPWFPANSRLFPAYSKLSRVPSEEEFEGARVLHPRYPLIPKVGMSIAPVFLALWTLPTMKRLMCEGQGFDVIDAHYFYPDGVAAALMGKWLEKPVVITGRGTDLNLFPQYRVPRFAIRWAARRAAAVVTVSESLRSVLGELGVPESKTRTLRNGVDLDIFVPLSEREIVRSDSGKANISLLSVGNLVELKGHDLVIRALCELPGDVELRIAGDGPEKDRLRKIARDLGLDGRVHFLGRLDRLELVRAYNAADMLVLASSREGMANVLLESMACGTPVVATDVGGNSEVVDSQSGQLIPARTPSAIANGVTSILRRGLNRAAVRRRAEGFTWAETTHGQLEMFQEVIKRSH